MMSQLQVLLFRDSFSTPWGIRLQGGKDLTSPLLIQRVFPNSPAVGYLQRGDILLSINGKDASALSHKEAQDIFQSAGGQIPLLIRRVNIQEKTPPQQKPKQHQQICPQPKHQLLKPHVGGTHKKPGKQLPFTPTMSPTLKTTTPTRKSPAKGKPKPKSFGGGGFSFGVDYSKVPVQEDYVPGPIYNEEELADELDQSYRTVPLDFEGPTSNMAHPHVPKGGMKYGGGGPIYGVNYAQAAVPAPVQRQSSKPWEDNEMLYKVQDTLSHISYPHQIGSYNGEPPQTHYQHVPAPPAYVPGPPPEPETYYVDPFPANAPVPQQEEDDEEYEFLPVSQRRNQFNKQDFVPDARKPIKPRSRPPSFKAPASAPAPAPRPVSAPVHQPVYAPVARPAEGQVVSDEAPAWAGTLSSASGAKLWDAGYQPGHNVSPTRSVSPPKKAGKQHPPPAPRNPQEFSPTKTQALDFSNDPDDGPRIMHLQYNSPLGMYSNENVQETLQGQTQAALGGGNTAKWLVEVDISSKSQSPTKQYAPIPGGGNSRGGAATSVRESRPSRPSPCKTPVRHQSPLKAVHSPSSSFYYESPRTQTPEPNPYQHHSPIRPVEPPRPVQPKVPSPQPPSHLSYDQPQRVEHVSSPSFIGSKPWAPVTPPVQAYTPPSYQQPVQSYAPTSPSTHQPSYRQPVQSYAVPVPPPPPPPPAPAVRSYQPDIQSVRKTPSASKHRPPPVKTNNMTPAPGECVPDYSYRSWGASLISPLAKQAEQQREDHTVREEPPETRGPAYGVAPTTPKANQNPKKHMVFEELTSALKKSSTFPKGTYAAKEFEGHHTKSTTVYTSGTTLYSNDQYMTQSWQGTSYNNDNSFYNTADNNANNNSESDPGYVTPPTSFENSSSSHASKRIELKFLEKAIPPAVNYDSGVTSTPFTIAIKPLVSNAPPVAMMPAKPTEIPMAFVPPVVPQPETETVPEVYQESAPHVTPVDEHISETPTEAVVSVEAAAAAAAAPAAPAAPAAADPSEHIDQEIIDAKTAAPSEAPIEQASTTEIEVAATPQEVTQAEPMAQPAETEVKVGETEVKVGETEVKVAETEVKVAETEVKVAETEATQPLGNVSSAETTHETKTETSETHETSATTSTVDIAVTSVQSEEITTPATATTAATTAATVAAADDDKTEVKAVETQEPAGDSTATESVPVATPAEEKTATTAVETEVTEVKEESAVESSSTAVVAEAGAVESVVKTVTTTTPTAETNTETVVEKSETVTPETKTETVVETTTTTSPNVETKTQTVVETAVTKTPSSETVVERTVTTIKSTETEQHVVTEPAAAAAAATTTVAAITMESAKTPDNSLGGTEQKIEMSICSPAAASKTEETTTTLVIATSSSNNVAVTGTDAAAAVKVELVGDQQQGSSTVILTPSEPTPPVVEAPAQESHPVDNKVVSDGQIAAPQTQHESTTDTQSEKKEGCEDDKQMKMEETTSTTATTEIIDNNKTAINITTTTTTVKAETTDNATTTTTTTTEETTSSVSNVSESNNSGAVNAVVVSK